MGQPEQPQVDPLNCMDATLEQLTTALFAARRALVSERVQRAAENEQVVAEVVAKCGEEARRRCAALEAARVENQRLDGLVTELMRENDRLRAEADNDLPFGPSEAGRD